VAAVIEVIPDGRLNEEEILSFCEALPRYKRPRKIFFGEIPRNPTGKVFKTVLRARHT
jgi:acyl-CoA synthetase (AMP-forming)/AMP-acid ligase II